LRNHKVILLYWSQ